MQIKQKHIHTFYYVLAIILFVSSFAFFITFLLSDVEAQWELYKTIAFFIVIAFTWFEFILMFLSDLRKREYPSYAGEKISVIMPCYNEEPALLERAIQSVVAAAGNKEIIVIDDGSKVETKRALRQVAMRYPREVKIFYFPHNKGKREALHVAITKRIRGKYIVTMDSDTVIERDTLVRVVEPLKNNKVGAVTGEVRLINEKNNWLTRMIATYYWTAFNVFRRSNSTIGIVSCCSGAMAAYQVHLVKRLIDEFLNQKFLGTQCTFSEDRHLTNLVLREGYKVVYRPEAVCHTQTPATVRAFLRQQLRWKRGYIRESTFALSFALQSRQWWLFIRIFMLDLNFIFYSFGIHLLFLSLLIVHPFLFLTTIMPFWLLFAFFKNIFIFLRAREKLPGLVIFIFFHEFVLYWQNIYALFTVRRNSWITR